MISLAGKAALVTGGSRGIGAATVKLFAEAGADVVMTTSALLRHGVRYMESLLTGLRSWLSVREIDSLDQIRGALSRSRIHNPDIFERANYIKILAGHVGL